MFTWHTKRVRVRGVRASHIHDVGLSCTCTYMYRTCTYVYTVTVQHCTRIVPYYMWTFKKSFKD